MTNPLTAGSEIPVQVVSAGHPLFMQQDSVVQAPASASSIAPAPQTSAATDPTANAQPARAAIPIAFLPLRPAEEFIRAPRFRPAREFIPEVPRWRRVFNFVYHWITALLSCLCCCFTGRPENRRRVQPPRQPVALALPVVQAAPILNAQPKERVREFLNRFPEQGYRDLRLDFYTAFKNLPREAQEAACAKVYEVEFLEIERIMRRGRDDRKGADLPNAQQVISRELAIDLFIRGDFFNRTVRNALLKFCEGQV